MRSKAQAGPPAEGTVPRVRSGAVPALADGFSARLESVPDLGMALVPEAAVALVSERTVALGPKPETGGPAGGGSGSGGPRGGGPREWHSDWHGSSGKTQLAVSVAEKMWQSSGIDLLIWITASSRPAVLAGYLRASAAALGAPPAGDGTAAAVRFVRWLGIDHPDTLARRASLANTYCSVGRLADAKTLLRDTADRCAQVLPPGDPLTWAVWDSLRDITGE